MNWRVGASTGSVIDRPIAAAVAEIQRAGIQGIEVATPPRHFDPARNLEVAALDSQLRAAGTLPVSVHAPFGGMLDLSDPNPHHRHAAIGAIVTSASALLALGGRIVVVHPTDTERNGQDVGARLDHCIESLSILARALDAMGLLLAVESPLPHLIGGDAGEFRHLLERVPTAGVC
ncbi:MAG TPA: TIM barrel protein, partial [Candidatus Eisenbacteria bacterium]